MIKPLRYTQVPQNVDCVQVTAKNMEEVANWCEGKLRVNDDIDGDNDGNRYIKVFVNRPHQHRQSLAFEQDWVVRTAVGFRVYTPKAFGRAFVPAKEESDPAAIKLLEAIFEEPKV